MDGLYECLNRDIKDNGRKNHSGKGERTNE